MGAWVHQGTAIRTWPGGDNKTMMVRKPQLTRRPPQTKRKLFLLAAGLLVPLLLLWIGTSPAVQRFRQRAAQAFKCRAELSLQCRRLPICAALLSSPPAHSAGHPSHEPIAHLFVSKPDSHCGCTDCELKSQAFGRCRVLAWLIAGCRLPTCLLAAL